MNKKRIPKEEVKSTKVAFPLPLESSDFVIDQCVEICERSIKIAEHLHTALLHHRDLIQKETSKKDPEKGS